MQNRLTGNTTDTTDEGDTTGDTSEDGTGTTATLFTPATRWFCFATKEQRSRVARKCAERKGRQRREMTWQDLAVMIAAIAFFKKRRIAALNATQAPMVAEQKRRENQIRTHVVRSGPLALPSTWLPICGHM